MNKYLLGIAIIWGVLAVSLLFENARLRDQLKTANFDCVSKFWSAKEIPE